MSAWKDCAKHGVTWLDGECPGARAEKAEAEVERLRALIVDIGDEDAHGDYHNKIAGIVAAALKGGPS